MTHVPLFHIKNGFDTIKKTLHAKRIGRWLPPHHHMEGWIAQLVKETEQKVEQYQQGTISLSPAITKLHDAILNDPVLRMYFEEMIVQPVIGKPYTKPSSPFKSISELMVAMDCAVKEGPRYDDTVLVGCPLNAVLDYCMATPAGFAAFRDQRVNDFIKDILKEWCDFLSSPSSCAVLDKSKTGWLSDHAVSTIKLEWFEHDPLAPYHGFKSWNDFFTRKFKEGMRPVASPEDDKVIVSSCESRPYCIQDGVKRVDSFWVKHQPYSLVDMLAKDELTDHFVGGSIYQAFLSATNYHRWHSPVRGTVVKVKNIEGTYFSEAESEGFNISGIDHSEGYLTAVAARAAIFIEADDPVIGLICVIYVGMGEVSSNVFLDHIVSGYKVKKGEEIGYFQFGGSTHCVIFRPGAIKQYEVHAPSDNVVLVNSHIATAN